MNLIVSGRLSYSIQVCEIYIYLVPALSIKFKICPISLVQGLRIEYYEKNHSSCLIRVYPSQMTVQLLMSIPYQNFVPN